MSNVVIHVKLNVVIEDQVFLGGGVQIFDSDFHSLNFNERMRSPDLSFVKKRVIIRKGSFIGANSIILKGVEIGERSIIAAGSVLTKSVPSDEIWGGNPAKRIRST